MHQHDAAHAAVDEASREDFAAVTLSIPVGEATRLARMQVEDLETTQTETGTEIRTDGGELVAVAASRRLRDGSDGTDLAYREAPADAAGTRTAGQIRRAVSSYAR